MWCMAKQLVMVTLDTPTLVQFSPLSARVNTYDDTMPHPTPHCTPFLPTLHPMDYIC
jgi:hypothetical protein